MTCIVSVTLIRNYKPSYIWETQKWNSLQVSCIRQTWRITIPKPFWLLFWMPQTVSYLFDSFIQSLGNIGKVCYWKGNSSLERIYPAPMFYLEFFDWGEVHFKQIWSPAAATKICFRPSRGNRGNVWKYNIQYWLQLHFWTLVAFTDSLVSSSNKISIWISF